MRSPDWPFRGSEAVAAGHLTDRQLRRGYERIYPGIWVPRGAELSHRHHARAAWRWSRDRAVIAGVSASAVLGAKWIDVKDPVELIHDNRHAPRGIVVHSDELCAGETLLVSGMCVTTPARTAFDLGRRRGLIDAVQRIDALLNATGISVGDIEEVGTAHKGAAGAAKLRDALELVDGGAESPPESLLRIVVVQHGFPRPETQVKIRNEFGEVIARLDLYWREYKLGAEYDGIQHWTDPRQRDWDIERQHVLEQLEIHELRVNYGLLMHRRSVLFDRLGAALIARGCPKTW